ncbi:hypothetical protein ITJ66_02450 [Plantibacter sp. VKM Ac-2885]|uniref:hypothetical protein n=1 Tax=Plantibacter sp. VKM Ac-2885 TaxID=2783828 RepID=UPI00188C082B|nr:hypothetical protein [Plantibacter sp. VKM Ac-2885]MBF4511334.1 hypothetical protein [Plantibacter sp. VKM Ac-2885]
MTRSRKLWLVAAVLFLALVAVQLWIIVSNWSWTSRDWFQIVLALVQVSLALTVITSSLRSGRRDGQVHTRPDDEPPTS